MLFASVLWAAAVGPIDALTGAAFLLPRAMSMWPAVVIAAAAWGWAGTLHGLWRGSPDALPIQAAVAAAVFPWLAQVSGAVGFFGPASAWALCIGGLVLGVIHAVRARRRLQSATKAATFAPGSAAVAALPAAAVLAVAAAIPPGWLWASEFGGYDVLSYHLQLPREWIELGRVAPLTHNVYAALPSAMEVLFAHAMLLGGTTDPASAIADEGWRLTAAQATHAVHAVLTAWLTARVAAQALRRSGASALMPAAVAGAVVLATPWVVVVGSMAYNEMAMTALLAGALLASTQPETPPGVSPWKRGMLAGLLVGAACAAKPSALVLGAPMVALALAWRVPRRHWLALAAAGAAAGLIMLAPWMARNAATLGNPVFPYATSLLGSAHWSEEQVQRWHASHHTEASLVKRAALLLAPDPAAVPRAPGTERHRGYSHPQWGALPIAAGLLGAAALAARATRRIAAECLVMLALQCGAWALFTHLQSRFLLPTVIPLAMLVAAGLSAASALATSAGHWASRAIAAAGATLVLAQAIWAAWQFRTENRGQPILGLLYGVAPFTGEKLDDPSGLALPAINRASLPGRLFLLGDATPLYLERTPVYHTTYDTSPLGVAVRTAPDDVASWTRALRGAGVSHVLLNRAELARLHRSGWYDPLLTPELIERWLTEQASLEAAWPDEARWLYRLRGSP